MVYLYLLHKTGADGTDQNFVAMATQREGNKRAPALVGFANAGKPFLFLGTMVLCRRIAKSIGIV